MQLLTDPDSPIIHNLKTLNVSGCRQLTDIAIDAVSRLKNLTEFETVNCIRISAEKNKSLNQARKFRKFKF